MSKIDFKLEITVDVVVTGEYTKGKDGVPYTRNGDPGDSPEPSEFEIARILLGGHDITTALKVAGFDMDSFNQQCLEEIEND